MARMAVGERPCMIQMEGVGLKVDGRSSQFDMRFFPATNVMAVVDVRDDQFVATLQ